MSSTTAVLIVMALVVAGLIMLGYLARRRSRVLHDRFAGEYDRVVRERGSVHDAERELHRRARRVERLTIRPLPPDQRSKFAERWKAEQAHFVDEPRAAVVEADHLVEEVMRVRGYPVAEFEQRAADISVDHPRVVENYRAAHQIAARERGGDASTEDLRKAMIYYRSLFEELLDDRMVPAGAAAR